MEKDFSKYNDEAPARQVSNPKGIKHNIYKKTAIHRFASVDEIDAYRFCVDNSFVNGSLIKVNRRYCYM
jgi:3-oxoacyl-[acyl-carrier protein] reductase